MVNTYWRRAVLFLFMSAIFGCGDGPASNAGSASDDIDSEVTDNTVADDNLDDEKTVEINQDTIDLVLPPKEQEDNAEEDVVSDDTSEPQVPEDEQPVDDNADDTQDVSDPVIIENPTDSEPQQPEEVIILAINILGDNEVEAGKTIQWQAQALDSNGLVVEDAAISWLSSDESVATVNESGVISGVAAGRVKVFASDGRLKRGKYITVIANEVVDDDSDTDDTSDNEEVVDAEPVLTSVNVTGTTTLTESDTTTLTVSGVYSDGAVSSDITVSFASGNPAVATVSPEGVVTAVAAGEAIITATSGDITGTINITVEAAVEEVFLAAISVSGAASVYIGSSTGLSATATMSDESTQGLSDVNWDVSNSAVATIDAMGKLTGIAEGSVEVTASKGDIISEAFTVTVAKKKDVEVIATDKPYSTNPSLGKYVPGGITIDGDNTGEWTDDMLIAIDMANDDPRSLGDNWTMHEAPLDFTHLWAAWDDENLYVAWQMVDVTDALDPSNAGAGDAISGNDGILIWMAIDTLPGQGSSVDVWSKENYWLGEDVPDYQIYMAGSLWQGYISRAVDGEFALDDDGVNYFPLDDAGVTVENGSIFAAQSLWGVLEAEDAQIDAPVLVDFLNEGKNGSTHQNTARDSFYEMKIPLSFLGLTKAQLESNGLGVMLGAGSLSALDSIPNDPATSDMPGVETYNSTFEWGDADEFTVPFARVAR